MYRIVQDDFSLTFQNKNTMHLFVEYLILIRQIRAFIILRKRSKVRSQTWLPVRSRRQPVRWRPHRLHEYRRGSVQDDGRQDGHQDGAVRLQVAQR